MERFHASAARYGKQVLCVLVLLLTYACGKDSVDPDVDPAVDAAVDGSTSIVTIGPNQKLATAPHRFDVYGVEGATRAVVFLHGGGGTKEYSAYQLGLKRTPDGSNHAIADVQLLVDHDALVVFPQGQSVPASPGSRTWNNYVMNSGQDDMQFIRDLAGYLVSHYRVSKLYVVGHSNGAMMVSRIWCEAPELFDAYVAIAGPPAEHFLGAPCSPATAKPFLSIVGTQDTVLQNGDWGARTWTIAPGLVQAARAAFVDPDVIGERYFFPTRVLMRCGGTVRAGDADVIKKGRLAKWSFCNASMQLIRIESGGHSVESLEAAARSRMLEFVFDFFSQQP